MDKFEEVGKRIEEEFARLKRIKNFEDFGKRVDEELERMKSFVKEDVAPETEKRTAQFLREVSEKLTEAAAWIEARNAVRNAQNPRSSGRRRRFEDFTGNTFRHFGFAQTRFPSAIWLSFEFFMCATVCSLCILSPLCLFFRLRGAQTARPSPPASSGRTIFHASGNRRRCQALYRCTRRLRDSTG